MKEGSCTNLITWKMLHMPIAKETNKSFRMVPRYRAASGESTFFFSGNQGNSQSTVFIQRHSVLCSQLHNDPAHLCSLSLSALKDTPLLRVIANFALSSFPINSHFRCPNITSIALRPSTEKNNLIQLCTRIPVCITTTDWLMRHEILISVFFGGSRPYCPHSPTSPLN